MTEEEWLGCKDPEPMLDHIASDATHRKLWLIQSWQTTSRRRTIQRAAGWWIQYSASNDRTESVIPHDR